MSAPEPVTAFEFAGFTILPVGMMFFLLPDTTPLSMLMSALMMAIAARGADMWVTPVVERAARAGSRLGARRRRR